MKKLSLLLTLSTMVLISGCKTQEDIRREKTVENLNEQMAQNQKSSANTSQRFQALEEQLAKLNGQLEELGHGKTQDSKESQSLRERISLLEENSKKQTEFLKGLNDKFNEQSKYIEEVVKQLSTISEEKETKPKKKDKKELNKEVSKETSEAAPVQQTPTLKLAIAKFKAQDYSESKSIIEDLLENKKLKKKDNEAALFYLGMIEFKTKNFEEAKVYFSKLFTEHQDSSLAPSALLNLSKTFTMLKAKEEAKQTLDELITRFPKSKEAVEAAKIKTKL